MDKKSILQQGYTKEQKVIAAIRDRNGKEHYYLFDTMEEAKQFTSTPKKQFITYFTKSKE